MVVLEPFDNQIREILTEIEEILLEAEENIKYPGKYNNPKRFEKVQVTKFNRLETNTFPLNTTPYNIHISIFHEYYDLSEYTVLDDWQGDTSWIENALERAKGPKGAYIAGQLYWRIENYRENFHKCLSAARKETAFYLINDDRILIKALISYFQSIIDNSYQLEIFYRNYINLTKQISDLFCQALILILEEKITFLHPESIQIPKLETYDPNLTQSRKEKKERLEKQQPKSQEEIETKSSERTATVHFPKPNSIQVDLPLNSQLQLMNYLQGQRVIRADIPNRHLAMAVHLLTTYSWKNMEKNLIKSRREKFRLLLGSETLEYQEKKEILAILNELTRCLDDIKEVIDRDIETINSKTVI